MRGSATVPRRLLRAATTASLVATVMLAQATLGCAAVSDSVYQPATASTVSKSSYRTVAAAKPAIRLAANKKVLPPVRGLYNGVFEPPAPFGMSRLNAYAKKYKAPAIVMWYQPWDTKTGSYGDFKSAEIKAVLKRGAIPLITWEPWNPGGDPHHLKNPSMQPEYKLSKIVNGEYDAYIRSWAKGAKAIDGPIMLRPMHEMNGYWYPWGGTANGNTPADFRAAWRHIHDIFAEEGVTNVTWVWSINWNSNPDTHANRYAVYYPGSAYVDWTSISGFNWGSSPKSKQNHSFEHMYTAPLAYLKKLKKPIVISEIGCNTGVGKAKWITRSYSHVVASHHEVKGIVYYDKREVGVNGTQNWQLSSSAAHSKAYKSAISSNLFIGASKKSLLGAASPTP